MTYRVIITPDAEQELRRAYRYIRKEAPAAAGRWIKGARKSIKTLARNPERCPLAPESKSFHEPIRELLYGKGSRGVYRILFVLLAKTVYILHVRHGSMDDLGPED
jgi:plasmid stabilization system protein ParE